MAIGKKIKRVIAFLAIPLMLLNSVSSYAADIGFNSGKYENLENIEIDNDKLSGLGEVSRPNACLNHYWTGGSCTTPQYCAVCKKKGSTLPHSMLAATCTQPRRCSRSGCFYTEGSARGHHWQEATCTQPQKCTRSGCSATQGTPKGHDWSISATCTQPARCKNGCGSTSGSPLGHSWSDPTCTEPAKCRRSGCGETKGSKLGHNWVSATCTTPGECSRCHTTTAPAMGHSMKDATCTQPRTCRRAGCSYTEGAPLGHDWSISATCTQPARCKNGCGSTSGSALGHMWIREKCTDQAYCARRCGVENLPSGQHVWRVIPSGEGQICDVCGTYEKIHYHRYTEFVACDLPMRCICGLDGGPETKPGHKLTEATCTQLKKCTNPGCTYSEGAPTGHSWLAATCTQPERCKNGCGETRKAALGHVWIREKCTDEAYCARKCGATLPPENHKWRVLPDYSGQVCDKCGEFKAGHVHQYTVYVACDKPQKCICGAEGGKDTIPGHDYYAGSSTNCKRGNCSIHTHKFTEFVSITTPRRCVCGAVGSAVTDMPQNDPTIEVRHPEEVPTKVEATNVPTITAGDPVNVFTGAHEIDFNVLSAGGAQNLTLGLSYKSNKSIYGIFGKGFSWNYESYIREEQGEIKLFRSSSDYVIYKAKEGSSVYTTDALGSTNDKLIKNEDGTYRLDKDGRIFIYDSVGRFAEITEKNGYKTQVKYFEDYTELIDGISGQKITLHFNEKNLVGEVTNSGTAKAFFEYDENDFLIKYTDPDGFVTQYTYDEKGQVLTGTDNDNNVFFENSYDTKGRVIEQKDASGKVSYFEYTETKDGTTTVFTDRNRNTKIHKFDKVGRLRSLTDEEGNTTTNEYDEAGNCIKRTDALNNSVSMEYDDRHNLVKSTDALENVTEYVYDENDNLVKIKYPNGSEVTNTYDSNNRLVSSTNVRGLTTTNTYDSNGYLLKTESGDRVNEFTYENGNLKTLTDSKGNVTTYSYDKNGKLIKTETPDGASVEQTFSPYGALLSSTDALGYEKHYVRNCFDKPLSITDEEEFVTEYSYDNRQLLSKIKDSKDNVTSYEYDAEERLVKTTYPDDSFTETAYDKVGRAVEITDAERNKVKYEYDAAGRVIKETDKNGKESTITYDANGNVISRTDRNSNTTSYTYDCMGRVLTETNAFDGVTEYTYNAAGDLISVKDPMGNVTEYTYDSYGNRTSVKDPNGNTSTFEYDLNGNLTKTTNALGQVTTYSYDSQNRLVSTKTGDVETTSKYDAKGQVVSVTDPNGNTSSTEYDKRGLVSKTIDALGNETSFVYDGNGNLVSTKNAKGKTTFYAVNEVNQVTKVTDALGLETSFDYDGNGRRNKSTNPLGGVSTSIFDKNGNALELIGPEGGTTSFTYDANNNLASRSTVAGNSVQYTYNALNLAESMTNARGQSTTYEYDLCGRIVKASTPEGEITYTYDSNSNVLTVTDVNGTITRTYDALNRVKTITDTKGRVVSYNYDYYGNLQTLTYPDNTAVSYTYDLCGNIKTVTDWEGRVTTYTYDALNREIDAVNAGSDAGGVTTNNLNLNLSQYVYWESGEYESAGGTKADHRRRMRLPELIAADYSEYKVSISEGYKLRFCEYAEDGSFLRSEEFTDDGIYVPGTEGKLFSVTLIKISGEKSLSPGQWNKIFAQGLDVEIHSVAQTENSVRTQKEYDVIGNLIKTRVTKALTGELIDETIYEYDDINRLVREIRPVRNFRYDYSYDDLSRVIKRSTVKTDSDTVVYEEEFDYDGAGNITQTRKGLSKDETDFAYVSEDNRIASYNGQALNFDNDGNLLGAAVYGIPAPEGYGFDSLGNEVSLSYDSRNRLIQGMVRNGAHKSVSGYEIDAYERLIENFVYDAEDYRVSGTDIMGSYVEGLEGLDIDALINAKNALLEAGLATDLDIETESINLEEQNSVTDAIEESIEESSDTDLTDEVKDVPDSQEESLSGNDATEESEAKEPEIDEPVIEGEPIDTETVQNPVNTSDIEIAEPEEESVSEGEITAESDKSTFTSKIEEAGSLAEDAELNTDSLDSIDELDTKADAEAKSEGVILSEEELQLLAILQELMASQHEIVSSNEYCYDRENKNLLVRFSQDGTIEKYVYGNGLIASYETTISEAGGTSTTEYQTYVYDIRGSVILALGVAGNTVAEYQYGTYGKRSVISGPDNDELGYCARDGVLTETSGLLYMRARYYYPDLMRFINQDIVTGDISNSSSLNRYAYVNGNPVTMIDPFGLCAEKASKSAKIWKWGTDIFKTAFGTALMFVPGMQTFGAGLIINGATGLVMDACDAFGAYIDPKTGAIITDAMQIAGGIACLFNPATAAYGATQIGTGAGGLAGGFLAEGLYNEFVGGEYGDTAFLYGNYVGNLIGDFIGGKAYGKATSARAAKSQKVSPAVAKSNGGSGTGAGQNSVNLPEFDGKSTQGVLVLDDGTQVPLSSGNANPDYKNYIPSSHVEGKAAIYMRENGVTNGTVYHNHTGGTCPFCNSMLPTLLDEGSTLTVVPPSNAAAPKSGWVDIIKTFIGNSDIPKKP